MLPFQELKRRFGLQAVSEELGFLTTFCGRDASRAPGMQGPGQQRTVFAKCIDHGFGPMEREEN